MIVPRVIGSYLFDVFVSSNSQPTTVLLGEQFSLVGANRVVFILQPLYVESDAVARPAGANFVANPEKFDTLNGTGSYVSAATKYEFDVSTDTAHQTGQAAIQVKLNTSTTPGRFIGRLTVILYSKGLHVGELDVAIPPDLSSTTPLYVLVGRVPSVGLSALRAALYGTGFKNDTVKWRLYVRGVNKTAAPDPTWHACGTGATAFGQPPNQAPNVCSGDVAVPASLVQTDWEWVDVALGLTLDTVSGPIGNLHVVVGGIYTSTVPVPRVIGVFSFLTPTTSSTAAVLDSVSPPFPIPGGDRVRFLVEPTDVTNDAVVIPTVTRYAALAIGGTPLVVSGTYTSGITAAKAWNQSLTTSTQYYLLQAGISYKTDPATDGTYGGNLTVILFASQLRVGEIAIAIPSGLTTAGSYYVVGRIPGSGLGALRAALSGDGFTANAVSWEFYVRGVTDTNAPATLWVKAKSTSTATAIAATTLDACSDDLTVNGFSPGSPGDYGWIDVAIRLTWDGSTTPVGGTLKVAIGGSYT